MHLSQSHLFVLSQGLLCQAASELPAFAGQQDEAVTHLQCMMVK